MCRNSLRYTLAYTVYDLLYLLFWSETLSGHPGLPKFQLQYHLQVEQKHDHMIPCDLGWKHVPRLLESGKKQESDMKVCACFLRNLGKLWTIILYSYNLMSNCTLCYIPSELTHPLRAWYTCLCWNLLCSVQTLGCTLQSLSVLQKHLTLSFPKLQRKSQQSIAASLWSG